jgi:hypothetical protein
VKLKGVPEPMPPRSAPCADTWPQRPNERQAEKRRVAFAAPGVRIPLLPL